MGFSRQEYCSGLPFPSLGDLPDSGIEPGSPALQADALPSKPPGKLILDFAAPQMMYLTVSIVSPFICHEVMGPDAMIFVF